MATPKPISPLFGGENPYLIPAPAYSRVRPAYPQDSLEAALSQVKPHLSGDSTEPEGKPIFGVASQGEPQTSRHLNSGANPITVIDMGAGAGALTAQLLRLGLRVIAVEPATAMQEQFRSALGQVPLISAKAEKTPLPDSCAHLVTYAQCWHWIDPHTGSHEARRLLRPSGAVAIFFNQMDVSVPWVHRLTRIMRSGDVHRIDRPPLLPGFTSPKLHLSRWDMRLTPDGIRELGTTRSSWLRASAAGRAHMRANLDWYLDTHLGFKPGQEVAIPHLTLTWLARPLNY